MRAERDKEREIARLRAQIVAEYQVTKNDAQGLTGAVRQAFVTSRLTDLWVSFEQLAVLVGSETEAMASLVELFDKTGNATDDVPPKFLHIGRFFINVAQIISVDRRKDGSVELLITHDNETLIFDGEEAQLFMQLFKQHCQMVEP